MAECIPLGSSIGQFFKTIRNLIYLPDAQRRASTHWWMPANSVEKTDKVGNCVSQKRHKHRNPGFTCLTVSVRFTLDEITNWLANERLFHLDNLQNICSKFVTGSKVCACRCDQCETGPVIRLYCMQTLPDYYYYQYSVVHGLWLLALLVMSCGTLLLNAV